MKLIRGFAFWAAIGVAACTPGGVEETAIRRGDVAFARDSLEDALSEYRLAVRQGGDDPTVLARAAHTFVVLGRVDEATALYATAAEADARWADMGGSDMVRLARDAAIRGEYFLMASAMEGARRLLPALSAPDLTLLLARHYFQTGEYGRALPLYRRAELEGEGSAEIAREIGEAQWGVGDCRSALVSFERYRGLASLSEQAEADWYIGTCSLQLARDLRTRAGEGGSDDLQEALGLVNRALEVGEPQAVQGQVWFEKGEILSALGDCNGSMEAFSQVRFYESPTSRLIVTAEQRADQVRIGRDLVAIRGRCG